MYKCVKRTMKAVVGGYKLDGGGVQALSWEQEEEKRLEYRKVGIWAGPLLGPHPGPAPPDVWP